MKHPYQYDIDFLLTHYKTDSNQGLSTSQANHVLNKEGNNVLPEKPQPTVFDIFLKQFTSPLIYILLCAALLLFFLSEESFDTYIIVGILLFNAVLGTIQEYRTQNIVFHLKEFLVKNCIVIRDGKKKLVAASSIVPGDIIIIQAGEQIPADARIIEAHALEINEAMLTGESNPVSKAATSIEQVVPLAQRINMIYSGTYALSGWGKALVVATGAHTEIGKISLIVQTIAQDLPLTKELERISWFIIYSVLILCVILFSIGFLTGQPLPTLLTTLIALFICVVPEGLPIVLTLVLVSGMYRMAKQRVLVKHMQAIEGIGHSNVFVIDKTGTITRNEMVVSSVFADNKVYNVSGKGYYTQGELFLGGKPHTVTPHTNLYFMAQALSLLNNATITFISHKGTFEIKGDPTEAAMYIFSQKALAPLEKEEFTLLYELPFDIKTRLHAGFFEYQKKGIAFITGSPETIIERSVPQTIDGVMKPLNTFLQQGLRIIAVAAKDFNLTPVSSLFSENEKKEYYTNLINNNLTFLGLCGIEDSIRSEVAPTIANAREAGLFVIMATGDHLQTAISVASKVGIFREGDEAIDGAELEHISDTQLQEIVLATTVFSRVSPEQKLRIIKALHAHHLIVAMTGDGINDAPALMAADIGIGMGAIGTQIAKEAADIILLDDSFVNIIHGVQEGRHIIYTLQRVIIYFFSTNFAEILLVLLVFITSLLFQNETIITPLTAAQILWLNLITDGFLDSGLAMEPKEKDILNHADWKKRKRLQLINRSTILRILTSAIPMAIGSFFIFYLYRPIDHILARTMTLVTLAMFQWFNAWNCRSETLSIFQLGFFSNIWLVLATILVFGLQLLLLYTPFFQHIFETVPLNFYQWMFIIIVTINIVFLDEIRKYILRKKKAPSRVR